MSSNTPSDDAEEPVAFISQYTLDGLISGVNGKSASVYREKFYGYDVPLFLHPPKPAEPELYEALKKFVADSREHDVGGGDVVITTCESRELAQIALAKAKPAEQEAKPVAWIQPNHLEKAQFMPHLCRVEPKQRADFVPLYLHPPKPAEPEAETIETLKAENFKLASGQCTEGGPWGDKGGTPYCKYAARKPMTAKEMLKGIDADTYPYEEVLAFVTGIRYAEKHHGIGGDDE